MKDEVMSLVKEVREDVSEIVRFNKENNWNYVGLNASHAMDMLLKIVNIAYENLPVEEKT